MLVVEIVENGFLEVGVGVSWRSVDPGTTVIDDGAGVNADESGAVTLSVEPTKLLSAEMLDEDPEPESVPERSRGVKLLFGAVADELT